MVRRRIGSSGTKVSRARRPSSGTAVGTQVKPFLQRIQCKKDVSVLHVGCGNSTLAEDMHENGYRNNQFCVDFVESVVKEMQKRSAEGRPEIKYETMDITDSAFKSHIDASFQLIVDKVSDSPPALGGGGAERDEPSARSSPRYSSTHFPFLDLSRQQRKDEVLTGLAPLPPFPLLFIFQGCLDTVVCGTDVNENVSTMLSNAWSCLATNGYLWLSPTVLPRSASLCWTARPQARSPSLTSR